MGILVALGALLSSSAHGDGDGYVTLAVEERTILRVDRGGSFLEKLRRVCFLPDRHTAGYLFDNFIPGRTWANADGAGYHRIDYAAAAVRVVGRRVPQVAP